MIKHTIDESVWISVNSKAITEYQYAGGPASETKLAERVNGAWSYSHRKKAELGHDGETLGTYLYNGSIWINL